LTVLSTDARPIMNAASTSTRVPIVVFCSVFIFRYSLHGSDGGQEDRRAGEARL